MKNLLSMLLISLNILYSAFAFSGDIADAKIVEIRQRPSSVIIRFDKKFSENCSDGGTWAILTGSDTSKSKQTWSLLLAAASAGQKVTITGVCGYHTIIETLSVHY